MKGRKKERLSFSNSKPRIFLVLVGSKKTKKLNSGLPVGSFII
jgi:hypothetical protein